MAIRERVALFEWRRRAEASLRRLYAEDDETRASGSGSDSEGSQELAPGGLTWAELAAAAEAERSSR